MFEPASSLAVENGHQIVMENTGIRINGHDRTDAFRQEITGRTPCSICGISPFPQPDGSSGRTTGS